MNKQIQNMAVSAALCLCAQAAQGADSKLALQQAYQQLSQGNNEVAVEMLTDIVKHYPTNLLARRYLVRALLNSGLAQAAEQQLKPILAANPVPLDFVALGDARYYQGDLKSALTDYYGALQLDAGLESARHGLINVYIAQGKFQWAQSECLEAIKTSRNASAKERFQERLTEIQHQICRVEAGHSS